MWEEIDDLRVRMTWECPECREFVDVDPTFYECNGTPVCVCCSDDMIYRCTEIYNNLTEKIM